MKVASWSFEVSCVFSLKRQSNLVAKIVSSVICYACLFHLARFLSFWFEWRWREKRKNKNWKKRKKKKWWWWRRREWCRLCQMGLSRNVYLIKRNDNLFQNQASYQFYLYTVCAINSLFRVLLKVSKTKNHYMIIK